MARTHAVVLGASMAGLGAARALSEHFDQVTLVERDALPDGADVRKGVPQASHAHGLLPSGYRILDAYFPGMMAELVAGGAMTGDLTGDFLWYQYGGWKLRADSGLGGIVVSRPFLEAAVRRRVRALPKISCLSDHDGEEPVYDAPSGRVTGLRVKNRATQESTTLAADLVVDASGRGSRATDWLASWGFGQTPQTEVRVDVGYATGVFERKPDDLYGSMGAIIAGTTPQSSRFAAVLGAENARWVVTLVGALRDYPPTELDGYRQFAKSLPTDDVSRLIDERQPLSAPVAYRFPANRHRHFDRMPHLPEGFLPLGDAICSFNPIFGQGMSVALSEAKALDECLQKGDRDLLRRFFARANAIIASPWAIATGEDFRFPQVEGTRPPGFALITRYMERAHRAANRDPVVLKRFFEVASLLAPPTSMMAPSVAWRVALGGLGAEPAGPANKVASPA
jgi:2-polyprenyl-6-methoxyphenol hydroxylase-like FAD-dependent oxidoreductase